jgi:hypothetical protein
MNNRIKSTQLIGKAWNDEIIKIELSGSFENFNYHTQNYLLKFGYKFHRSEKSQKIALVQVDTMLSEKMLKSDIEEFADFIYSQILSIQIRTVLNMIPYDFVDWATRDTSKRIRFFRTL